MDPISADHRALTIERFDSSQIGTGEATTRLVNQASEIFKRAVPAPQRDDRFEGWEPPGDLVAAVATSDGGRSAVGYVGGSVNRDRLQLDAIVIPAADDESSAKVVSHLLDALEPSIAKSAATTVELWGRPAMPWHSLVAEAHGFADWRSLHQLRCSLPVDREPMETRPFRPGGDEAALRRVNNRAFADHPDQGALTVDDIADITSQPWFRPDGVRLLDDPVDAKHLAGFCITKIHDPIAPGEPPLGEIYAIGIDPDHHGQGLGTPMTAAGLTWLADHGLDVGMLYVEANNTAAMKTYARLGFEQHRTDRAWSRRIEART